MSEKAFYRKEDNRLVRGLGRFVDDEGGGRALHLKLVRSPYAHAKILAVDVSAAEALDGVVCALTGAEIAALTLPFPQMAPSPLPACVTSAWRPTRCAFRASPWPRSLRRARRSHATRSTACVWTMRLCRS